MRLVQHMLHGRLQLDLNLARAHSRLGRCNEAACAGLCGGWESSPAALCLPPINSWASQSLRTCRGREGGGLQQLHALSGPEIGSRDHLPCDRWWSQTVTRLEHHLATLCTAWGGCAVGSEWLGVLRIVEGKVAGLTEAAVE